MISPQEESEISSTHTSFLHPTKFMNEITVLASVDTRGPESVQKGRVGVERGKSNHTSTDTS